MKMDRLALPSARALVALLAPLALVAGCSSANPGKTAPKQPIAAAAAKPAAAPAPAPSTKVTIVKPAAAAPAAPTAPAPAAAPAAAAPAAVAPAAVAPTTPAPAAAATPAAAPAITTPDKELPMPAAAMPASFLGFQTTTLEGKPADLSAYKGKVLLVVNTASKCGLTPQYTKLEQLHESLAPKGFSVLGFPSNDFGGQEPGTPTEIREFCTTNYGVTFPLFGKVQTKAGEGQSPIYNYLGTTTGSLPRWNFGKYLIGKDGKVIAFFDSKVEPDDPSLKAAIDKALGS